MVLHQWQGVVALSGLCVFVYTRWYFNMWPWLCGLIIRLSPAIRATATSAPLKEFADSFGKLLTNDDDGERRRGGPSKRDTRYEQEETCRGIKATQKATAGEEMGTNRFSAGWRPTGNEKAKMMTLFTEEDTTRTQEALKRRAHRHLMVSLEFRYYLRPRRSAGWMVSLMLHECLLSIRNYVPLLSVVLQGMDGWMNEWRWISIKPS